MKFGNKEKTPSRNIIRQQGIICILVGFLLIITECYIHVTCKPEKDLYIAALSFLETIGIALAAFGLFSIIIDSGSWREYFASRLRDIVIEQNYLDGLDVDTLKSIQTKVLKAFFHDSTIDKEGSFLNYFHLNLHRYISEPYREDATKIIVMREVGGSIEIQDTISYTCRKAGGEIQKTVNWAIDPGEFLAVKKLKIEVQYPFWHPLKTQSKTLLNSDGSDVDLTELRYSQQLNDYRDIDGLVVKMESTYMVDLERFQYWQMAHPTKNFHMSVSFPKEFSIQLKPLVLHPEFVETVIADGYAMVKYDTWMLPQSGVAFRFIKKSKPASVVSPDV
jgi:hypothetical protein